jgi:hypothetical protein
MRPNGYCENRQREVRVVKSNGVLLYLDFGEKRIEEMLLR